MIFGAAAGLAGFALLGLTGPAGADGCLDQVRELAGRHGTPSDPPTVAPNGNKAVTTEDLARSGGVIKPPPVQDKAVITPGPGTHDPMPTIPDVATKKSPQDGDAAERTQLQAALTAARAQAERGDELGCQEALARARTLARRSAER
jgi:hypothetical protein